MVRAGDVVRQPELADALERLGSEGAAPFFTGDIAAAIVEWLAERGGIVTAEDLAAYEVVDRTPIRVVVPRAARSSPTRRRRPAGS